MSDISFTSGPPETVLDQEPEAALNALVDAGEDVTAVGQVCMQYPRFLAAWARLGDLAPDQAFAYAAYRTGYHRGLDRLRQNGWRGSGYVRWVHEENRGFLTRAGGPGPHRRGHRRGRRGRALRGLPAPARPRLAAHRGLSARPGPWVRAPTGR